jgi:VanZ family protein
MSSKFPKLIRFLPALLWMGVIFYFSTRSTTGVPGTYAQRFIILKSFHLIEYAVLFLLLFFGFQARLPSAVMAYLYALSDEFHQSFTPGREPKFRDTLIDLTGIFIGMILLPFIIKIINSKKLKSFVKIKDHHS